MIILIPIGGIGQRFKDQNYKNPKALIDVKDKKIIFHLLDNLNLYRHINDINFIYIPYNKEYVKFDFENIIKSKYPKIKFKFLCLKENTRGAAETIYISLQKLINSYIKYPRNYIDTKKYFDEPILCLDSDNFYTCDILSLWNRKNTIFTIIDKLLDPKYSYVIGNNIIEKIIEKEKISDNACTGAYGFESFFELNNFCFKVINSNRKQKGEFYTSSVIQEMIENGKSFLNQNIKNKNYFSLGTPEQLNDYEYSFLFDLDGTLVNTDNIYIEVWDEILSKLNISVDENFFNNFIKGNDDYSFLKNFFITFDKNKINEISKLKDKLFIEKLNKYNGKILIDGVINFIEKNKNKRICIVTNSNESAANEIIKKTGLDEYVEFMITTNDCINKKPDKEPYENAIKKLNSNKNKCVIFEDSHSGLKSAIESNVYSICIIINKNTDDYILNSKYYKIKNYNEIYINELLKKNTMKNKIIDKLKTKLSFLPINDIINNNNNLKTGYICDIKSYKLIFKNNTEDIILKLSNDDNELAYTAARLNLYNNEIYFYENISTFVDIKIPYYYGYININKKSGIILRDLNKIYGTFNLDLNKNTKILIIIIDTIAQMHNKFKFNNDNEIIECMKNLKKINEIEYYSNLVNNKFKIFIEKNKILLTKNQIKTLNCIHNKFKILLNKASEYPLSFCHGDLKSPNIFYKNNEEPIFLDWQYIHLNKGISDIAFLLVESINFDKNKVSMILSYYYYTSNNIYKNFNDLLYDFKISLCLFPFFVTVWFNSEESEKMLDKTFPIRFMKNTLKYYDNYIDCGFLEKI